jgi:cytochrome c oxidase cbb3-type subunit 4
MLSGIITAILIVAFCGICAWAWSARRRDGFEAAARMALEDDEVQTGRHNGQPR